MLQSVTEADLSTPAFAFATCREIEIGAVARAGLAHLLRRASWAGSCTSPIEQGARVWDTIWEAGQAARASCRSGIGVYGTTGRLEKGYRAYGDELEQRVQPGGGRAWRGPGSSRRRSSARRPTCSSARPPPAAVLCTLTVDDHTSRPAKPLHAGRRAGPHPAGEPLVESAGRRSYVTSAGSGPSVGKHLLLRTCRPDQAGSAPQLAVEYMASSTR